MRYNSKRIVIHVLWNDIVKRVKSSSWTLIDMNSTNLLLFFDLMLALVFFVLFIQNFTLRFCLSSVSPAAAIFYRHFTHVSYHFVALTCLFALLLLHFENQSHLHAVRLVSAEAQRKLKTLHAYWIQGELKIMWNLCPNSCHFFHIILLNSNVFAWHHIIFERHWTNWKIVNNS